MEIKSIKQVLVLLLALCLVSYIGYNILTTPNQPQTPPKTTPDEVLAEPLDITSIGSPYGKYNGEVYVAYCIDCVPSPYKKIEGADLDSFEVLKNRFARDKSRVYINGEVIEGADPITFKIIEVKHPLINQLSADRDHLFLREKLISDNPSSYRLLYDSETNYSLYYEVNNNVYLFDSKLDGVDPNTFKVLAAPYSADASHVYCGERIIRDADPETFVTFQSYDTVMRRPITLYGKDSTYAYFCSPFAGGKIIRIEEVDISSFDATNMENGYARDKYREFYFKGYGDSEKTPYKVTIY